MRRHLVALAALSIALIVVLFRQTLRLNSEQPQAPVVIELPAAGDEVRLRYITEDETGRKVERVEFRSGITRLTGIRKDGTIESVKEIYPPPIGVEAAEHEHRQLKRLALYQADGTTLASETTYRIDSTLEFTLERLDEERVEMRSYYEDGATVRRHKIEKQFGYIMFAEDFYPTGATSRVSIRQRDQVLESTSFSEAGVRLFVRREGAYGQILSDRHFYEDGKTVRQTFEASGSYTIGEYFDADGVLRTRILFEWNSAMTVIHYGAGSTPLYQQKWVPAAGGFRLVNISELDASGRPLRTIEFALDGKTPSRVTVFNSDGTRTVRIYRVNGTLEEEQLWQEKVLLRSAKHGQEEAIVERYDREMRVLQPVDKPTIPLPPRPCPTPDPRDCMP